MTAHEDNSASPASSPASASLAEETRLLVDLEKTLASQLAFISTGHLDSAADCTLHVQSLLTSLRSLPISPAGLAVLSRARAAHEQVALALRQQQAEVKAELTKLHSGKTLVRAYGQDSNP